ncbi:aminoacyltransferase [Oenococcus sp. UCMA 17063]|nr:aminoacyltransferase [Oenococcus sp. UCMA 17063]
MELVNLSEEEYNRFEQRNPKGSFYQSILQKRYYDDSHQDSYLLGIKEKGKVLLTALMRKIKSHTGNVYEIMGGPLVDSSNESNKQIIAFFLNELHKYLKKRHAYYLRIVPNEKTQRVENDGRIINYDLKDYSLLYFTAGFLYRSFGQVGYGFATPHYEYQKNIQGLNKKTLFKSYSKKTQYSIKKTYEFGIKTRNISYEELKTFHDNTAKTAERLGFYDKTLSYYQSVYKTFGDNAKFMIAEIELSDYINHFQGIIDDLKNRIDHLALIDSKKEKATKSKQIKELRSQVEQHEKRIIQAKKLIEQYGGKINLAGALFFIQPQEISYMFSYTNVEFKNFYGPYRIQADMLEFALTKKVAVYNFYGVSGDRSGRDGVYEFKKGFQGYMVDNMGAFILPINKLRYQFLQTIKKIIRRK